MNFPGKLQVKTLIGQAIIPHLPDLASLRIEVFRDWPYLYDGKDDYERDYMRSYAASPRAAIIAAMDGEDIVGVSTCLPLADETANVKRNFEKQGLPIAEYFYFSESVLKREYRNLGLGVAFFAAREAHAKSFGETTHTAFCAVQRPESHPLRPVDYQPLDAFWTRRGYAKQPNLHCVMRWLDIGETEETNKTLIFWTKALN